MKQEKHEIRCSEIEKRLGKYCLFEKSYKNTRTIAGAMNNMMGGINQQTAPGAVPPPIPTVAYHVAVNGQATGPFDISVLAQMATAGQLTADSLVWKNGMAQWAKAGTVDELKNLFSNVMPPIPPVTD